MGEGLTEQHWSTALLAGMKQHVMKSEHGVNKEKGDNQFFKVEAVVARG